MSQETFTLYKNKGETIQCQLQIDGASAKNTTVRLCLEFADNKNMFFYGKLAENGACTIDIPKLKELDNKTGTLAVEVIADETFFRLMEAPVEVKSSVEVALKNELTTAAAKKPENAVRILEFSMGDKPVDPPAKTNGRLTSFHQFRRNS